MPAVAASNLRNSPAVGRNPASVASADVNTDGRLDLVCANYEDDTLTVLTNNGSGGFTFYTVPTVGNGQAR